MSGARGHPPESAVFAENVPKTATQRRRGLPRCVRIPDKQVEEWLEVPAGPGRRGETSGWCTALRLEAD